MINKTISMNTTPSDKPNKLYYSIAEVAERFNVNQSTLRFWEKEFPQIAPKTNKRGVRQYREEDIELVGMIYYLVKEKGMKISSARQRLIHERQAVRKNCDITTRLKHIRNELKAIRKDLDRVDTEVNQEIKTNTPDPNILL